MSPRKDPEDSAKLDKAVAEARRNWEKKQKGYRARALDLLPWICALCGREFTRERLRELTVHHKDHNHHNNPADGSNWELLCIYCHENEHSRLEVADAYETSGGLKSRTSSTHQPFADLKSLLKTRKKKE